MKKYVKLQLLLSPALIAVIVPKLKLWLADYPQNNLSFSAMVTAIDAANFLVYTAGISLICTLAFNWKTYRYERTTAVYLIIPIAYMLLSVVLSYFLTVFWLEGLGLLLAFVVLYAVLLWNAHRPVKSVQKKR